MENHTGFIGKWTKDGTRSHPLLCHLLDTAAVVEAIWRESFGPWLKRRCRESVGLPEKETGRLLTFWTALHDLGKASPTFQALNEKNRVNLTKHDFPFPNHHQKFPHNFVTTKVLPNILAEVHRGVEKAILKNVATAVGGHHGSFPQADVIINLPNDEVGGGIWDTARQVLVTELAHIIGVNDFTWSPPEELTGDYPFFTVLAGLTSISDWIASANAHFFPRDDSPRDNEVYWEWAQGRAGYIISEVLKWKRWHAAAAPTSFGDIFPALKIESPFPLQKKIAELACNLNDPALVIVEAPMGEGKTEAALFLADKWLRAPGAEGFYIALPTMATSNQMFGRVKDFLDGRYDVKDQKVNLHLLHAQAALVADYEELKPKIESPDLNPDQAVIAAEWFTSKKRGLISPFGVGTVDQALMAVLQVRHVFVRLYGLAGKVVVVDEVHAYDAYMSTLLDRLLGWLAALGAPVILLSATLPKKKRLELLKAYGTDSIKGGDIDVSYPRISIARPGRDVEVIQVQASPERKQIVKLERVSTDPGVIANHLATALEVGGCAAVICNTVARAQEMYLVVRDKVGPDNCLLLHSRFPYDWRREREERAEKMFGKADKKGVKRPDRFVLVGTQVLEQSLDLDFDLMVTDLAPADFVLQRMGRLHRHERSGRPTGLDKPNLWLMWPEGDDGHIPDFGASAYVYDLYILLRSWLAFKERTEIKVPDDLETIIEEVYGEKEPGGLSETWRRELTEAQEAHRKELEKQETEAEIRIIKRPTYTGALARVAQYGLAEDAPEYHPYHQALTRLGGPSVTVVCLHNINGELCLDTKGKTPINYRDIVSSKELVKRLISMSVSIARKGLTNKLLKTEPPPSWKRNTYLRNCRPLIFEKERITVDKWMIELDRDLGLSITYGDADKEV